MNKKSKNWISKRTLITWMVVVLTTACAGVAYYMNRLQSRIRYTLDLGYRYSPNYRMRNSRSLTFEPIKNIDKSKRIKMLDVLNQGNGLNDEIYDKAKENYQQ